MGFNFYMIKYVVVSFGSSRKYLELSKNITNQFNKLYPQFEQLVYSSSDLSEKINKFAKKNSRGYGYWIWKPYLIHETLKKLDENDIIFYTDGRCGIENKYLFGMKIKKIEWVEKFLKSNDDIALWRMGSNIENQWTSQDLFEELNINNDKSIKESGQFAGTFIMIRNNTKTKKFINNWLNVCNNTNLLTGKHFKNANPKDFIEHRHDQSALSVLIKLNKDLKIFTISDELYLKTPNIRAHKYTHPT